jgi:hypothetical protein
MLHAVPHITQISVTRFTTRVPKESAMCGSIPLQHRVFDHVSPFPLRPVDVPATAERSLPNGLYLSILEQIFY